MKFNQNLRGRVLFQDFFGRSVVERPFSLFIGSPRCIYNLFHDQHNGDIRHKQMYLRPTFHPFQFGEGWHVSFRHGFQILVPSLVVSSHAIPNIFKGGRALAHSARGISQKRYSAAYIQRLSAPAGAETVAESRRNVVRLNFANRHGASAHERGQSRKRGKKLSMSSFFRVGAADTAVS